MLSLLYEQPLRTVLRIKPNLEVETEISGLLQTSSHAVKTNGKDCAAQVSAPCLN